MDDIPGILRLSTCCLFLDTLLIVRLRKIFTFFLSNSSKAYFMPYGFDRFKILYLQEISFRYY